MKKLIAKMREHLTDAVNALDAQDAEKVTKSLEEMVILSESMHTEAENIESKIQKLEESANTPTDNSEILAKMDAIVTSITENKTAIEKFAEVYQNDSETLAETLVKMSRPNPSKQNEEEEEKKKEKQSLSKSIFNF